MSTLRRPVLAANWKMNVGPTEAASFFQTFLPAYPPRSDRTVIFFPSALSVAIVRDMIGRREDLQIGVQNVHTADRGAFTGEISAGMAAEAGATFILVGHSERRHLFGETDSQTAQKCVRVEGAGLTPVLCVGETGEQRAHGSTSAVVLDQLRTGLSEMSDAAVLQMAIAYEPVWAIGTGRTSTPDDASIVHRVIRAALVELVGEGATEIPILYGGSVNVGNASALLASDQVDGLLVGGASLDPLGWAKVCAS